ncbi:DUF6163 family protein [Microbaculum sp. FT89]|uniref:DUF6163 family protein n=1 Tax=Microbaculum sp. FT89 TaxID=3447298 RepID=UPI003F531E9F
MPLQFAKTAPLAPTVLLWYLRSLAFFYFVNGLMHWARIIGVLGPGFETMPVHVQVATIYFALLQVVAAVGLWCGAAWGVAAWLFSAVAELVMHIGFADLFGSAWLIVAFHSMTILVYVGLAWWTGTPENTGEILRMPEE